MGARTIHLRPSGSKLPAAMHVQPITLCGERVRRGIVITPEDGWYRRIKANFMCEQLYTKLCEECEKVLKEQTT